MSTPIPIVIDTDLGTDIDDALALVLALASPEVNVLGVTVVDGDVDLRARMVARLLGMVGRSDIPVYKGMARPLGRGRGPTMRGHEGRGLLGMKYGGPEAVVHEMPAPNWLVELSKNRPFHLVAIGPFTNVARALQLDEQFAERLLHLTVMGGMVHEDAYSDPWQQLFSSTVVSGASLDHNTASDPQAALIVAQSGLPITWVTAELTFCLPLHRRAIGRLADIGSELSDALMRMLIIWDAEWFRHLEGLDYEGPSPFPQDIAAFLHDPLALASTFGGPWLSVRDHELEVSVEGDLLRLREVPERGEIRAGVSIAVDADGFETFFLDRVEGFLRSSKVAPVTPRS
jgi:purine nucleosidase